MLIKAEVHPPTIEAMQNASQSSFFGIDAGILSASAPYLYLTGAFAALFATLYVTEWFWILPHSVLLTFAGVHAALVIRRRYLSKRRRATA